MVKLFHFAGVRNETLPLVYSSRSRWCSAALGLGLSSEAAREVVFGSCFLIKMCVQSVQNCQLHIYKAKGPTLEVTVSSTPVIKKLNMVATVVVTHALSVFPNLTTWWSNLTTCGLLVKLQDLKLSCFIQRSINEVINPRFFTPVTGERPLRHAAMKNTHRSVTYGLKYGSNSQAHKWVESWSLLVKDRVAVRRGVLFQSA